MRPERRDLHGVFLLDKPRGLSSNDALQRVKFLFCAKKAGHTGALDPLATGMLPICFGEATKFSRYLLEADKRYRVIAKLGERTDTSDAEGKIIQVRPLQFCEAKLNAALADFRGESLQIPSMYSALKYQGRPLYEYARRGIEVARAARKIIVHQLTLIRHENAEIELDIHCSKGTYIRTIIDDLGEKLGCGAHVIMLRRLQVASYPPEKMLPLEKLQLLREENQTHEILDNYLMSLDSPTVGYPEVPLPTEPAKRFRQGQTVKILPPTYLGLTRVIDADANRFLGMAKINEQGYLAPHRLVSEYSF